MSRYSYDTANAPEARREAASGDFTPLPPGTYRVRIEEATLDPTKAGDGRLIRLLLRVEGPTHVGRVIFDRLLVEHPTPTAQEISLQRLHSLLLACGMARMEDTRDLVGKTVEARLVVAKPREGYAPGNDVRAYLRPGAKATGGQPPRHPPAAPAGRSERPSGPEPSYEPPPIDDSDLPF